LKDFVKLNAQNNQQDSAITKIHPKLIELNLINPIYPIIGRKANGWASPKVGDQLQKCGRTTAHTTGSVIALHGTFTIQYDFGPATFQDCIVSTFMSKGGDSGSIIYDFNMNAIGLLFAGSDRVTISNPIEFAKTYYGLEIWDGGSNAPTPYSWTIFQRRGKITTTNDIFTFECAANYACYAERFIDDFNTVECVVNTGTDTGATWSTGLTVLWPNGSIKVNLRCGGQFGGYYNSDYNINIGRVRPNTDYGLRIRKLPDGHIVGEVQDSGRWVIVVAVPSTIFRTKANRVRIGKTDLRGASNDHDVAGAVGISTIRDFKIS
jgi:hypothetical protein